MKNQEQKQEARKFVLVGFNPIVATETDWEEKGDVPTAVSPDGKKFKISDTEEHEGCVLDRWVDEDGHTYFELMMIG